MWLQTPHRDILPMSLHSLRKVLEAEQLNEYQSWSTVKSHSKPRHWDKGDVKVQHSKAITKIYGSHCSSCLHQWSRMEYAKLSRNSQKPAGCFSCLHQSCPPDPCQRLPPFTCNDRHLRGTLTGNTCCHLPLNSLQTFHVLEIFCRSADVEVLLLPRKQYPIFKNVITMTGKSSN